MNTEPETPSDEPWTARELGLLRRNDTLQSENAKFRQTIMMLDLELKNLRAALHGKK